MFSARRNGGLPIMKPHFSSTLSTKSEDECTSVQFMSLQMRSNTALIGEAWKRVRTRFCIPPGRASDRAENTSPLYLKLPTPPKADWVWRSLWCPHPPQVSPFVSSSRSTSMPTKAAHITQCRSLLLQFRTPLHEVMLAINASWGSHGY